MPLGAARLTLLAFQPTVAVVAEVIRKKQSIQAFGNAQIDTAQYKFGGSSADFDGTGDYVTASNTITLDGDFTIEGWYRADSLPGTGLVPLFTFSDGHLFYIGYDGGNTVYDFYKAGSKVTLVPVTISGATWYHAACVRSGSTISIYHNGTLNTTGTYSGTITATLDLAKYSTYYFDGHFDEVRISDTARYTSGFTPSTTPFVNDDNTKLLLHCDGTDGSTYFDDDNGVGRAAVGVVAIADAQIDTAQYKLGGASAYFDGTGDLLQASTDASLTISSSEDFTIEGWIRPGSVSSVPALLTDRASSLSLTGVNWDISIFNGSYLGSRTATLLFETGSGAGNIIIISNNNVFTTNTWYHFAVVRSSNVISLYVNGVDVTNNRAGTQSAGIGAGNLTIGGFPNGALMYTGHFDEIRWSNTARYTSAFTPSTAPFVNDANTKLLLHMDGTDARTLFLDDNGTQGKNVVTQTKGGTNLSTTQKKFGATSAFFDGDYDGLHMFDIGWTGANAVTVECWAYWTTNANSTSYIWTSRQLGNTLPAGETQLVVFNTGQLQFNLGSNQITMQSSTGALALNTWTHIAVTKNGNIWKLWVDGSSVASASSSQAITVDDIEIGQTFDGSNVFTGYDGYIDEFRVSNTERYTATFTPATAPFTYDSNTLALFHMEGDNNGTVFNNDGGRQKNAVTALGNAQIDTAQYKFGGSSALFDGTGDYLTFYHNIIATNDFVFEGWVRFNALPSSGGYSFLAGNSLGNNRYFAVKNESGTYRFESGVNGTSGSFYSWWNTSLSTGTWYHIALVKNGTSLSMYQDGSALSITGTSGSMTQDKHLFNGGNGLIAAWAALSQNFNGWMDEIRISNTARYTTTFTPSTTPFQNDANTLLLLHMDGTDASTDFDDDNGKESA